MGSEMCIRDRRRGGPAYAKRTGLCHGAVERLRPGSASLRALSDRRGGTGRRQDAPAPGGYGCAAHAGGKRRKLFLPNWHRSPYLRPRFPCAHAADSGKDAKRKRIHAVWQGPIYVPACAPMTATAVRNWSGVKLSKRQRRYLADRQRSR